MAISFKEFKKNTKTEQKNIFFDLHLDIEENRNLPTGKRDIVVDKDINAIKNSLYNIFTTNLGENLLNPEFGCNLKRTLFEAITPLNASMLGTVIKTAINKWENRVSLTRVDIFPDIDNNEYLINIIFTIPSINQNEISFSGSVNNTNFKLSDK